MHPGSARAASAPSTLTSAERARLVGILGRLGSDHDGERAAAGLLASRLLNGKGLTWDTLISTAEAPPDTRAYTRRPDAHYDATVDLALCRRHAAHLSTWQAEFVASLAQWQTPWSAAQRMKLRQVAGQLRARGLA